jgi:NAD(P)-dependent dehydrogenase (short-subunit alcohol dehydrogenase family)
MPSRSTTDPRDAGPKPPFEPKTQPHPGKTEAMSPRPDHGEESYRGLGRLKGRIALITGGDSGIGRAVAIAFAREGADVAISYLEGEEEGEAEETKKWIEKAGGKASVHPVDFSRVASRRELVKRVVKQHGRIDVLVNNAAFQGKAVSRFEELSDDRIHHTFATNVEAMFTIVREALPHMQTGATIINTTSIQAMDPSPPILDYAATKAAILELTKGLAKELLERGIRVNAVAPGPVWTPLVAQSFDEEKLKSFGEDNPMKRPAQPAELAPAFVFLACDESRFVNGETIAVTGGRLFE